MERGWLIAVHREWTHNQYAIEHDTLHSLLCQVCWVLTPTVDCETVQYADSDKEHYDRNAVDRVCPERASAVADYDEEQEAAYVVACRPCSIFQRAFGTSNVHDRSLETAGYIGHRPDAW